MQQIHIRGAANVLIPDAGAVDWQAGDVLVSGARIDRVAPSLEPTQGNAVTFDAEGLLVLPGIVDIHGDAFERQVQPRPETVFSYDIAMAETDRQLVANGITTACHGLTFSWEGGLRGREAAQAMLRTINGERRRFQSDHRIHLRFENHHVDGLRDALEWITFPRTVEALDAAMDLGNKVVMGAPNVLLGGSHCGGLATTEAVRKGACHILASDYYYPSLLHAPFRLAFVEQACSLAQAWRLVAQNPANALGLRDRGRLAAGCRADMVLVEATVYGDVRLVATIASGRIVYCAEPARLATARPYPLAA